MDYTSPGLIEEIIQELSELLKSEPENHVLWFDYGNALMNAFYYEKALEAYEKAIKLDDNVKFHLSKGIALHSLMRYDEAISEYNNVLQKVNNYPDVYFRLGLAYAKTDRSDKAIEQYIKALDINPDYVDALYHLAEMYKEIGMYLESLEIFKKIVDDHIILKQDTVDLTLVHYDLAYLYTGKALFDDAIKHLERVAFTHPEYADVHYKLGKLYKKKGDISKAMLEFEKAIRINPNYKEARDEYWNL